MSRKMKSRRFCKVRERIGQTAKAPGLRSERPATVGNPTVASPIVRDTMNVRVRTETATDVGRTFAVVESAFGNRLEADLVDALRRSASPQLSLVAESEGHVVGHVFFSPVTIDSDRPAPSAAQLASVAVLPECQRQGVGSALIRAGLDQCGALGWSAVFVVGDPAYYSRFGFGLAGSLGFSCPGPLDRYLQLLELRSGALSGVTGCIRLHPSFAEVGAE
jgi:putative acetyltransferase